MTVEIFNLKKKLKLKLHTIDCAFAIQEASKMSDQENRYHEFLQPIRDLASNWDIDIAESLENYLDELENLSVTFDISGNKDLNFAEAALLIQGSTAIYSKKVEYLHQLVIQALSMITNQKSKVNEKDNENNGKASKLKESHHQYWTMKECYLALIPLIYYWMILSRKGIISI